MISEESFIRPSPYLPKLQSCSLISPKDEVKPLKMRSLYKAAAKPTSATRGPRARCDTPVGAAALLELVVDELLALAPEEVPPAVAVAVPEDVVPEVAGPPGLAGRRLAMPDSRATKLVLRVAGMADENQAGRVGASSAE